MIGYPQPKAILKFNEFIQYVFIYFTTWRTTTVRFETENDLTYPKFVLNHKITKIG